MNDAKFIGTFDEIFNDEKVTYLTNALGRGLWRRHADEDRQVMGTAQFGATSDKNFRAKIRKMIEKGLR